MTKSDKEKQQLIKQTDKILQNASIQQAETIGKLNKQLFKNLKELANSIENKTKEILKLYLDDNAIKKLYNNEEIIYTLFLNKVGLEENKKFVNDWIKALKKVDNSFVSDNFILLLNAVFETLHGQSSEEKLIQENILMRATDIILDKDSLIKEFNDISDEITNNNREIAELEKEYFNTLKKENIKDSTGKDITASIMNSDTIKIMGKFKDNKIDEIEMFKQNDKTKTQLKVLIETTEKDNTYSINMRLKIDKNYLEDFINISVAKENQKDTTISTYQPTAITTYKVFNDKVSNTLSALINNQKEIIKGTGGNKYKDLEIKALISNAEIKESKVLSQWDKYILQAIYSVSINNPYFDINMIKRALNLKSYQKKTSIHEEIRESVEKMRITKISLDIAKELNETYKIPLNEEKIKSLGIESYLLPLKKLYKKVGGTPQEMYCFIEKPIYFTYIEARNQILNLETKKLLINGITDTKENTMLKIYLKTRIDDMKYQKTNKNSYIGTILYDTLFKENDLLQDEELQKNEKAYNKKRDTYRNTIKEILNHYKDIKDIKDYEEIRENRKFTKIQITL